MNDPPFLSRQRVAEMAKGLPDTAQSSGSVIRRRQTLEPRAASRLCLHSHRKVANVARMSDGLVPVRIAAYLEEISFAL